MRNTWQILPENVHFRHPLWEQKLTALVEDVKVKLGVMSGGAWILLLRSIFYSPLPLFTAIHKRLLPSVKVEAQLYKLLLYEIGGKFVPHRDSEKVPSLAGASHFNLQLFRLRECSQLS